MPNTRKNNRKNMMRKNTRKNGGAEMNIKNNATLPAFANTFHGVHHWFKAVFEKLGWMVLAKAKGYDDKIAVYKKSIERLMKTLEHLSEEYESKNRKHDLNVLMMHVKVLDTYVNSHM